eukprot:jgi/Mesvir1/3578/Mv12041-RA.1
MVKYKSLEKHGLTPAQAEAIVGSVLHVTGTLHEKIDGSFTPKSEMNAFNLTATATISQFKHEAVTAQESYAASQRREIERLRADLDKIKSELKWDIDKLASGTKLDLNLERGRLNDMIRSQEDVIQATDNKLDREINAMRTYLEATKYDVIKYCVATMISIGAVGLAVLRLVA